MFEKINDMEKLPIKIKTSKEKLLRKGFQLEVYGLGGQKSSFDKSQLSKILSFMAKNQQKKEVKKAH